jgi:hypothetical protein
VTAFEGALHTLRTTFRLVATHKCETPASSRAGSFNGVTLVHESARMERMLTSVAPHIACYGMRAPEGLLKRCRRWIAENVVPFRPGETVPVAVRLPPIRDSGGTLVRHIPGAPGRHNCPAATLRSPLVRFWHVPATPPAARAAKESTGFPESLKGARRCPLVG